MTKAAKWTCAALVLALMAAGVGLRVVLPFGVTAKAPLEGLSERERNLVIFDAAMNLLKQNHYDSTLFQSTAWKQFESAWRAEAEAAKGGALLYLNVLPGFALQFPDSHVYFESPAAPSAATGGSAVPDAAAAKKNERMMALFLAGPGFEAVSIRRGPRSQFIVGDVLHGSPAARAGVTPGWALGPATTSGDARGVHYKATFFPLTPTMVRATERSGVPPAIEPREIEYDLELLPPRPDFETRQLAKGVTYLRFDHFNDGGLVNRVLDVIDGAGPAGLVIDLRSNSGGNSLHANRVIGRLLGDGAEVGTTHANGSSRTLRSFLPAGARYEGPLVLLIGPASMSAAEITASAVQDHKRGTLIGRTTAGLVLTARKFGLPDGGTMTIPVQNFRRPDHRRIEGAGVEPDIWILPTLEDVRAGRDPVLERALTALRQ